MITSDEGLIDYLTGFLRKSTSQGYSDHVAKINWYIKLDNVTDFANVEQIVPRIRNLFSSAIFNELAENNQLVVRTFLDTYDGKIKDMP